MIILDGDSTGVSVRRTHNQPYSCWHIAQGSASAHAYTMLLVREGNQTLPIWLHG